MNIDHNVATTPYGDFPEQVEDSSGSWRVGGSLPDGYVIRKVIGIGGMGTVFLVERKIMRRNLQFAVKTLSEWKLSDPNLQRAFLKELRTWIDLPCHPNLVVCRFFRTYGDRLAIFSDYIKGGSLAECIKNGMLGSIRTILDIAIQIAWGIEAVHSAGVLHQDIKPGNIMIASDGSAKITDFGLSRAAAVIRSQLPSRQGSELVSCNGMTIAYCSPEQYEGKKISIKTDIWSFGLTLLEMFTGKATWRTGTIAELALTRYLEQTVTDSTPRIPENVIEILEGCFKKDPAERWESMKIISDLLIDIYKVATGEEYARKRPETIAAVQSVPINERSSRHGVIWRDPSILLDRIIHQWGDSEGKLKKTTPPEFGSVHALAIHDLELYEEIGRIMADPIAQGDISAKKLFADVLLDKATVHEFLADSSGVIQCYDRAIEIAQNILDSGPDFTVSMTLANALSNKGTSLREYGSMTSSLEYLNRAADLLKTISTTENTVPVMLNYGKVQITLGALNYDIFDFGRAIEANREAIEILETIVYERGDDSSRFCLAVAHANNANVLATNAEYDAAIQEHKEAAELLEPIIKKDPKPEWRSNLANIYHSIALSQSFLKRSEAIQSIEKSIAVMEQLVNIEHRKEYSRYLLWKYRTKAMITVNFGQYQKAIEYADIAIQCYEKQLSESGRDDLMTDMANTLCLRAEIYLKLGDKKRAQENRESIADFLQMNLDEEKQTIIRDILKDIDGTIADTV